MTYRAAHLIASPWGTYIEGSEVDDGLTPPDVLAGWVADGLVEEVSPTPAAPEETAEVDATPATNALETHDEHLDV